MAELDENLTSAVVLVLAPLGADAAAIGRVVADMDLERRTVADIDNLCRGLDDGVLMLVVTEEGLGTAAGQLVLHLDRQPVWSDLPIVILSAGRGRRGGADRWRLFERLGNVTILDRPVHIGALQSAIRSGLRDRERQYVIRGNLEALQDARDGLEQTVADRTEALEAEVTERQKAEAALSHTQRLEAIGQLTGGVAHDFNNLLQVIMGGLASLERHADNPIRRSTVLDAMRQAGERGAKLTQQLLAFARRQPLSAEALDIAARIAGMRELLRGSLRADLAFRVEVAANLWWVEADPIQLEVAMLNMLVNARDATPAGGEIALLVENMTAGAADEAISGVQEFVRITVADTGSGMDEATLNRAFEPFFTTKPLGLGTGLGLSQVYGFVRQSGGRAEIVSQSGRGTSVSLLLPRTQKPPPPELMGPTDQIGHRGGLMLVVEDEPQVAAFTCAMLEDLGYECIYVANADAALQLDLHRFVGVFSDVVMPGSMDGVSLAKELRRRQPELPILLTTGFAGSPERVAKAGFPLLKKPYGLSELSAAVGTLLARG